MGPHLGQIEGVDVVGLGILFRHHLDADAPFRKVSPFNGFEEVSLRALPILPDDFGRLRIGPRLDSLHGLEVELDPETLIVCIDEAVGVAAVAVDKTITLRQTASTHQDGDLVQAFRGE